MSTKNRYMGACLHCGRELAKSGATRHVASCPDRPTGNGEGMHLVVESAESKDFWLHIVASPGASLAHLDQLLRHTWLECCGHLSSFEIDGERFESATARGSWGQAARSMRAPLDSTFGNRIGFRYEYDFGSTTPLVGRCVGVLDGVPTTPLLRVVARNHIPRVACQDCGEPAAWLGESALCLECTGLDNTDQCLEQGLLPVVNSPRMGVCAYTGEDPPGAGRTMS